MAKTTSPAQLHVKLSPNDAKKLGKLAKSAKLSLSDAVRSMIRSTAAITGPATIKEN